MIRQNTGFQRTQWGGLSGAPSRGKRERFLELGLAWVVLEGRASWLERLEETRGLSGPLSTHTLWGWLQPPACNTPTHPVTCTDCYCLIDQNTAFLIIIACFLGNRSLLGLQEV